MLVLRTAALGICLVAAIPAAAVELVVNGGFETGGFSGFTRVGATGATTVDAASANSGSFGASFSPNAVGSIFQDIATVAGRTYNISYALAHTLAAASANNSFSATFGTTTLQSLTNVGAISYAPPQAFSVLATSAITRLQFNFRDGRPTVFRLDDVSVSAAAIVPEPGSWALMIAGFGLAGTALRRRRAGFAA